MHTGSKQTALQEDSYCCLHSRAVMKHPTSHPCCLIRHASIRVSIIKIIVALVISRHHHHCLETDTLEANISTRVAE